jgi:type III restriction enzyme
MSEHFFERPILNSPYVCPARHWELDAEGQPTDRIIESRRRSELITPVPKPQKRRRRAAGQARMVFDGGEGLSTEEQEYNPTPIINEIRHHVEGWRNLANPNQWQVTPETARLLQHWRHHKFENLRPFFCQIEAVETAIWLAEVASDRAAAGARIWTHLRGANKEANPELLRIALKLATAAGKTTVMAMLIAWQMVNAVRHPGSNRFSRAFLVITPGIPIKDRLRVLLPNDPNSYYRERELVPNDMLGDIASAKIVVTNYHAFRRRERIEVSKVGRALLQGRGPELKTFETEGEMMRRACGDLMGLKNIVALNDEAHHCYREKPQPEDAEKLKGEEKEEAKKNNDAARLWISGIETVKRNLGLAAVFDLSATPFFLRGSGYAEGTLFPWTVSDFSLMDSIECGIVKLPRVPVADNVIDGGEMPKFRELWKHVGPKMPKKGRGKSGELDPLSLPAELQTALEALYGHYAKTFALWEEAGVAVPPVFIVVCNNTSTSKLVYDFISGFVRESDGHWVQGRFELLRNHDDNGNRLARSRTLLIDSEQLESGEALDENFRKMAADEIERFRREIVIRKSDTHAGDKLTDQDLLREVMNTVGKPGQLGESIRCVVSVSMLTEGWDANTVTHILGVRAFGTQLLCEQVVGRGLRRQSYQMNEEGRLSPEYADVLGIPFDFTAKPVIAPPTKPVKTVRIEAVRPGRDAMQITFPRVEGYRVELPEERLTARFTPNSLLELTPELVGPSITKVRGIIGEGVELTLAHLKDMRRSTILFRLARRLLFTKFRDPGGEPKLYLFNQLKRISREWLDGYLRCTGGTYPAQLMYQEIADCACERIAAAITASMIGEHPVKAVLDPYNPTGSTAYVRFDTSKTLLWETAHDRCHVNWVVCDSDWEAEFCRAAERNSRVHAYVKNQGLGFEVPYLLGATPKKYLPDFIVRVNDGHGGADLLNLVVEVKGYRGEDAKDKANTMGAYWVPGINNLGSFGRWEFVEFKESVYAIPANFDGLIERAVCGNAH